MWQSLHDAWWRLATQSQPRARSDVLACRVLSVGSLAYGAAVSLRNAAYDRGWLRPVRLPCRVISVGNLTVGGTGKTACVELIARHLLSRHRRVAVLSRGYGGTPRDYTLHSEQGRLLVDGGAVAQTDGLADEPQLLAMHLDGVPVLVGRQREDRGRTACRALGVETVIVDDGLQRRQLARDLEVILLNIRMPLGGWPLLPRGPMREPLSALRRADVVILTKADEALERIGALTEQVRAYNPQAAIAAAVHEPVALQETASRNSHEPGRLSGARVGLVSSIGDPDGFEATIKRLHATVLWHWVLPDHYAYAASDWTTLTERGEGQTPDVIVTTEKDWVRLRPLARQPSGRAVPVWLLQVRMKLISGEAELHDRLDRLYRR